ncbi:hypothetical protein D3C84_1053460 [compost metagenome]
MSRPMAKLAIPGIATLNACGNTMMRIAKDRVIPMENAASLWPRSMVRMLDRKTSDRMAAPFRPKPMIAAPMAGKVIPI